MEQNEDYLDYTKYFEYVNGTLFFNNVWRCQKCTVVDIKAIVTRSRLLKTK